MFIAWHFETASTPREREKHFSTFLVNVRLMVLEVASLEKKKKEEEERRRRRKKMMIFDFFEFVFLAKLS